MNQVLYDQPAIYDALYDAFTEDIPFYAALAREAGGPVCELACGSGRVTVPLGKAGIEVIGIDASPQMLSAAEARAHSARLPAGRVVFAEGDMRSPLQDGRFSLVIIPLHSLSHLLENSDVYACLNGAHAALRPGGRLAFAIHNPDPRSLAREADDVVRIHHDLDSVAVYESTNYDAERQILNLSWYVEAAEETKRFDYALRMFFPQEIRTIAEYCGFTWEARYGWYDGTPFTPESGTQIIVLRR